VATEQLVREGWHVFAADMRDEVFTCYEKNEDVTPLKMDITSSNSVEEAFQFISDRTDSLDAVVSMAGMLVIGSLVELPISDLERALEVNLLGIYRVNKRFLPLLLRRKGRIVIFSSEVGRQTAAPFNGIYSISKHALEAYSDALRRELSFLGIKVVKIQPGPFKTRMTKNAKEMFKKAQMDSVYFKENLSAGISYLPKVYKNASDPFIIARILVKVLHSKRPRTAYLVKCDLPRRIIDLLPVQLADLLIEKALS